MNPASSNENQSQQGSASLEFLGVTMVLMVPLVYLVIVIAQVQAASFAAHGAAHDVGRVLAQITDRQEALAAAHHVVQQSFADHGIEIDPTQALTIECENTLCDSGFAIVSVQTAVSLPGVPDVIAHRTSLQIDVSAQIMSDIGSLRLMTRGQ